MWNALGEFERAAADSQRLRDHKLIAEHERLRVREPGIESQDRSQPGWRFGAPPSNKALPLSAPFSLLVSPVLFLCAATPARTCGGPRHVRSRAGSSAEGVEARYPCSAGSRRPLVA